MAYNEPKSSYWCIFLVPFSKRRKKNIPISRSDRGFLMVVSVCMNPWDSLSSLPWGQLIFLSLPPPPLPPVNWIPRIKGSSPSLHFYHPNRKCERDSSVSVCGGWAFCRIAGQYGVYSTITIVPVCAGIRTLGLLLSV